MTKKKEPDVIPAWRESLSKMSFQDRARFALALGFSPSSVGNWVAGRNVPRPVTVKAIERRLQAMRGKA